MKPVMWIFSLLFLLECCRCYSAPVNLKSATNVRAGVLVDITLPVGQVVIKPRVGEQLTYLLGPNTQILKSKRKTEPRNFHPGDEVVVRFRKSKTEFPLLYEITDKISADWLNTVRKQTMSVTLVQVGEGELTAEEGAERNPVTYRFTDKTLWGKSGKDASEKEFKPSETVYIVPRLLPSGGLMATAIADTPELAARLRERNMRTLTGTIKTVDIPRKIIKVETVSGDQRELALSADCMISTGKNFLPVTALKAGDQVSITLKRSTDGDRIVTRITLRTTGKSRKATPAALPRPASQRR